ncbi:uncharacterized protein LOC124452081 [Xenia sp. Carnegie-2017]|uniref:uncharacterized protein LOC124452081 n=1 Tax=Xenia sp. Carnegie-2017 TaxID=2897299 RepID=UPI001F045057|nr:uncharacterized protein LOC124452081 [Xenia sp. Carnegie-2017]
MAPQQQAILSILTALISSIIAFIQLNITVVNYQESYERERAALIRLLSIPVARNVSLKRLNKIRQARPRRFWVRPGRTSAWWESFLNEIVIPEEWRENFRMGRVSLYRLAEELRPFIQGKDTVMRTSIDPVKQVAITLYYLSDEGRLRKTANAFGISRQTVSKIVRKVCKAITVNLGPKYIKLPFTEEEVNDLVKNFTECMDFLNVWEPLTELTF